MGVMVNGLTMLHVPYTTQDVFKGLALIGALCVSQLSVAKS
jgi:ribose/xylose/arabinose/galactoside ABC-type transport system permease subunit